MTRRTTLPRSTRTYIVMVCTRFLVETHYAELGTDTVAAAGNNNNDKNKKEETRLPVKGDLAQPKHVAAGPFFAPPPPGFSYQRRRTRGGFRAGAFRFLLRPRDGNPDEFSRQKFSDG